MFTGASGIVTMDAPGGRSPKNPTGEKSWRVTGRVT